MDIPSGVKIDLSGKVAFVSGASKGIGIAIAEALADAGADLVLTARDEGGWRLRQRRPAAEESRPGLTPPNLPIRTR